MFERDARSEFALKFFERGFGVGVWRTEAYAPVGREFRARRSARLGERSFRPWRCAGEVEASVRIGDGQKRAAVAGGDVALFEQFLDGLSRFRSRKEFAIVARSLPVRSATCSCVS